MDPLTLLALGGVLGLGQSAIQGQQQDKQRQYDAAVNFASPWTGKSATPPASSPDYLGNILGGASTAAGAGQSPWLAALLAGQNTTKAGGALGADATPANPASVAAPATGQSIGALNGVQYA
jgi:hypothetical protein